MSESKNYAKGLFVKQHSENYTGISVKLEDFYNWAKELVNDKGYVNLTMGKKKEVGKYGDTHYIALNEWKPSGEANRGVKNENKSVEVDDELNALPF